MNQKQRRERAKGIRAQNAKAKKEAWERKEISRRNRAEPAERFAAGRQPPRRMHPGVGIPPGPPPELTHIPAVDLPGMSSEMTDFMRVLHAAADLLLSRSPSETSRKIRQLLALDLPSDAEEPGVPRALQERRAWAREHYISAALRVDAAGDSFYCSLLIAAPAWSQDKADEYANFVIAQQKDESGWFRYSHRHGGIITFETHHAPAGCARLAPFLLPYVKPPDLQNERETWEESLFDEEL